ncbi:MAG: M43 family zinc metalloprotease, partial [Bacteroidales bacterium]
MKKFTILSFFVVLASIAFTQNKSISFQTVPKQKGVSIPIAIGTQNVPEKRNCGTMEYLQLQMQQDPTLKERMEQEESKFEKWIETHQEELANNKTVYTIPVVVHIACPNGANFSAARVQEQIDVLNEDYRKLNADGANVPSAFQSARGDCQIEFCLATKDPSGNSTTGIEKKTSTIQFSYTNDDVKYASSGGWDAWDPTRYMNIWVCNLADQLLGYAAFPPVSATYGVVILYSAFGITGASAPFNLGRTTTHEIGHCFTLYHIWGNDNGGCSSSDQCNDTPNQDGPNYYCPSFPTTDACTPSSPGVMFMNFMDYVDDDCMTMFTNNQASRVQSCISTYLTSVANNAATACSTGPAAPVAAFTWTPTSPVVNTSVQFTDQSTNTPTSWAWDFGDGGISTIQTPTHTYTATGTKNVCLTATNSLG